jgi:hypothetical protein
MYTTRELEDVQVNLTKRRKQMKHKLNKTTLAVAAMLCGLCMPAMAQEVTIGFNSHHPIAGGWKAIAVHAEDGYTMTPNNANGAFVDNGTFSANLDQTCVGSWSSGLAVTFTRDDGAPFKATRITVGALLSDASARWTATGHLVGGGTVVANLAIGVGPTVVSFGGEFNNLTSLVLSRSGGQPTFDNLVLNDADPQGQINFDYYPPIATLWYKTISQYTNGVYTEDGYTLTQTVGTGGGILAQQYNTNLLSVMTGPSLVPWGTPNPAYSIKRTDGVTNTFKATRMAVGSFHSTNTNRWSFTGHYADGGTVSQWVNCPPGVRTVLDFGPDFNNLTNLVFASVLGQPILDGLVLEDAIEPPPALIKFDVDAPAPNGWKAISAYPGGVYTEDGYTMTQTGGSGGIFDKGFNVGVLGAMAGPSLVSFSGGITVSFKRTDGVMRRFKVKSMAVGAFSDWSSATWNVTGHYYNGGTITTNVTTSYGVRSIINFAPEFDDLIELIFSVPNPSTSNQPVLDLLELGDAPWRGGTLILIQ